MESFCGLLNLLNIMQNLFFVIYVQWGAIFCDQLGSQVKGQELLLWIHWKFIKSDYHKFHKILDNKIYPKSDEKQSK